MRERIEELEAVARRLEPNAEERARIRDPVIGFTERFLEELAEAPCYHLDQSGARRLGQLPVGESGLDPEVLAEVLEGAVTGQGLNPASGGHLGYIPGGGLYPAALGDYVAAVTNEYAGIGFAGPGAVEMENQLIRWMAELVGFPETAGGNLASGGSVANLIAVVTAREARGVRAVDVPRTVAYGTDQTHHCVAKALHIAGLGEAVWRSVPMDSTYRMDPQALRDAVAQDRAAGRIPWLLVASAGTTDAGSVDPLAPLGRIAEEEGLWYHVDAAYGGFFLLVPEIRPLLQGMAEADSVVLDPHKGLFLPYGIGAVLVRDDDHLRQAHARDAAYLQDAAAEEWASPADRSPELTKHWRGPRMWLPLLLFGLQPFRAALTEKHLLARYFRKRARGLGFEVGPEPELSVVLYRWVPEDGDPDAFNRELLKRLHSDGRVFVSSTTLDGRFYLRLAILSFRTHLRTVDLYLEMLASVLREMGEGPEPHPHQA